MIIWYGSAGLESAGKLAAWLGLQGVDVKLVCKKKYMPQIQVPTSEVVVVWGRKLPWQFLKAINAAAPIGNKLQELGLLLNAGVPVPGISQYKNHGWLARKAQHHDGNDLVVTEGAVTGDFYIEPIPTTYEFRVNVFRDPESKQLRVFRTGLKIPKPGTTQTVITTPVGDIPIRTGSNGWTWTYSQSALNATNTNRGPLRELAVKAVGTLGYDFGAVDVGYRLDGRWVVFEVNSAPALEGDDLERYGSLILNSAKGL